MKFLTLIIAAILLSGCTQTQQESPPKADVNTVTIQNFAFGPATLTVKPGTTVTWTNQDPAPHKLQSEKFSSGNLNEGNSFQFTFTERGTYDYICSIHPSMNGKIIVE